MHFIKETDEVYRSRGPITRVTNADITFLKNRASINARRRLRLCAHPDSEDHLHEMLIVHMQGAYVPPHKHLNKSESFHIIDGMLKVFLFDDEGRVTETIQMGEPASGQVFFYRLASPRYHSVLPQSEFVVFHEVTNGPFDPQDTIIAQWAPAENNLAGQKRFTESLLQSTRKS